MIYIARVKNSMLKISYRMAENGLRRNKGHPYFLVRKTVFLIESLGLPKNI